MARCYSSRVFRWILPWRSLSLGSSPSAPHYLGCVFDIISCGSHRRLFWWVRRLRGAYASPLTLVRANLFAYGVGYTDVMAASLSNSLVGGSSTCLDSIQNAFAQVDTAFSGSNETRNDMASRLLSCGPLESQEDIVVMASVLKNIFSTIVQYVMCLRAMRT